MKNEKEPWYSNLKGRKLNEDNLLSLYERYHESMDDTLNRHFNVRNYYTALLSALLGLYVGGILQLTIAKIDVPRLSTLYNVLFILPVTVLLLSPIALFSTTRYYTAWLRRVALVAKIENILGIDSRIKTKNEKPEELIWRKDERFMDKYYVESRRAFDSSEDFIEKKKFCGDNLWAVLTFAVFFVLGAITLVFHILWL